MENRELIIEHCRVAQACNGEFKRLLEATTEAQFWHVLIDNMLWVYDKDILIGINIPLEYQLAAVTECGSAVRYITNPSEAVQLAAVTQDPWAIWYIANPSESVQMAAVTKNPHVVGIIKEPCEAVKKLGNI